MAAFTDNDTRKLETQVKASESYRLTAYRSMAGTLTIGYGHNCAAAPVSGIAKAGDRITPEQAEGIFQKDLTSAVWSVRRSLPWVRTLTPARQAVLYEMTFAMGLGSSDKTGLLSLDSALREMEAGDYAKASENLLASHWAERTGSRASRLARQLKTGEWQ
jgi:Phage-related lysozyme (muraminidase)